MKYLVILLIGIIIYLTYDGKGTSTSSYNEEGFKIVQTECEDKQKCLFLVGEECQQSGFTVVSEKKLPKKYSVLAQCKTKVGLLDNLFK